MVYCELRFRLFRLSRLVQKRVYGGQKALAFQVASTLNVQPKLGEDLMGFRSAATPQLPVRNLDDHHIVSEVAQFHLNPSR